MQKFYMQEDVNHAYCKNLGNNSFPKIEIIVKNWSQELPRTYTIV